MPTKRPAKKKQPTKARKERNRPSGRGASTSSLPKAALLPRSGGGDLQRAVSDFPLDHLSASSMILFSSNPILFKIKCINGDQIDTTTNISAIVGRAFHRAMEVYYDLNRFPDDSEAVQAALEAGVEYVHEYPEGYISWSKTIDTRQKATEKVSFIVAEYLKQCDRTADATLSVEERMRESIDIEWRGERLKMPVPLKGFVDRMLRDGKGRLKIEDYKTCSSFSNQDRIDGAKILQAVEYYLLAYATYGEEPYSMTYKEVKTTKNRDGSPQVREYEVVFAKHKLYFDFYFRLYTDIVRALNGEMVYVPNVRAMFDNEVAIVAYIQRLDEPEEAAKLMERHNVSTITDLLKSEINTAGNIRDLLKAVDGKLASEKTVNYKKMKNEEKIRMKLIEHGIVLKFDSRVEGCTVDLYRFIPSVGVKMSKIRNYADDLRLVLETDGVRVQAPIPGTGFVGVEVPRKTRTFPAPPDAVRAGLKLSIGQTINGDEFVFDLKEAPHMLVAGSTGSGKSVFLHSVIRQLLRKNVRMHICDPKQVELCDYEDRTNYLTEGSEIAEMLADTVIMMSARYSEMRAKKVRDWAGVRHVIVIDEYADLMFAKLEKEDGSPVESLQRLAQKGRAAGIHIILATQRASVKVISGDIKVNFPCKAVFRMAKEIDSKVMLDEGGAERLLGKGDMLFAHDGGTERLQGYLPAGIDA